MPANNFPIPENNSSIGLNSFFLFSTSADALSFTSSIALENFFNDFVVGLRTLLSIFSAILEPNNDLTKFDIV